MTTKTKPRKRSLATANGNGAVVEGLKVLAREYYFQNKAKNAADNAAKKARTSLFSGMLEAGVKVFTFKASQGGASEGGRKVVELEASVGLGKSGCEVDMAKLRELVNDDEKLLTLVTMTKKGIVDNFGTNMADQVCKVVDGTKCANVKPKS